MVELINTTLEFARSKNLTDVDQVTVTDVATAAWSQTPTAEATLEIESSGTLTADEHLLQQAFENLFRNAVEHGGPSVTIWVSTTADSIYVEDNGPGILPVKREQLLEQDLSRDTDTGLGFAITRAIVNAHSWSFSISEGREGGARNGILDVNSIETE